MEKDNRDNTILLTRESIQVSSMEEDDSKDLYLGMVLCQTSIATNPNPTISPIMKPVSQLKNFYLERDLLIRNLFLGCVYDLNLMRVRRV